MDYQSPEDYQTPKKSDYKPPEPHYQTPQPAGKERTKSQVGDLNNHEWFHGHVSRLEAEMLIEKDGQFLVRESTTNEGQYVLSGMKDGQHRHLLLVDPEGQVYHISEFLDFRLSTLVATGTPKHDQNSFI